MRGFDRTFFGAAFVGWACCAIVMGIGQSVTTSDNALVIHAIAAPIVFELVSFAYFRRTGSDRVLSTAVGFTVFVMAVDLFLMALLVLRSLAMFESPIGTWIPFGLIFSSSYLTGRYVTSHRASSVAVQPAG